MKHFDLQIQLEKYAKLMDAIDRTTSIERKLGDNGHNEITLLFESLTKRLHYSPVSLEVDIGTKYGWRGDHAILYMYPGGFGYRHKGDFRTTKIVAGKWDYDDLEKLVTAFRTPIIKSLVSHNKQKAVPIIKEFGKFCVANREERIAIPPQVARVDIEFAGPFACSRYRQLALCRNVISTIKVDELSLDSRCKLRARVASGGRNLEIDLLDNDVGAMAILQFAIDDATKLVKARHRIVQSRIKKLSQNIQNLRGALSAQIVAREL